MNLNAYDNIKEEIDKTKTWIDVKTKKLLSREIKYRQYYSLLKRFNPKLKINEYFIALIDNPPENKVYRFTFRDDYGRIKLNITSIWNESGLMYYKENVNVNIKLIESDNDGDIYLLDI